MIIKYNNIALSGKTCIIDEGFSPSMFIICEMAYKNNLKLFITSSKRNSVLVPGSIVPPAAMSNHLVGHAIDCNIEEKGRLWTSKELEGELSDSIKSFISEIKSLGLRWGGDFSIKDVVHFDDGLNIHNPDKWHEIYNNLNPIT